MRSFFTVALLTVLMPATAIADIAFKVDGPCSISDPMDDLPHIYISDEKLVVVDLWCPTVVWQRDEPGSYIGTLSDCEKATGADRPEHAYVPVPHTIARFHWIDHERIRFTMPGVVEDQVAWYCDPNAPAD